MQHLSIRTYEYKGISVRVKINFDMGTISLVERQAAGNLESNGMKPKSWVFAERQLEYMKPWLVILDAMKFAIKEATKELEAHQEEMRSSFDTF